MFTNIVNFLENNPREILLIDLQADDNTLHELYNTVLTNVDGFTDMMYSHNTEVVQWPTMSELIERNERYERVISHAVVCYSFRRKWFCEMLSLFPNVYTTSHITLCFLRFCHYMHTLTTLESFFLPFVFNKTAVLPLEAKVA